MGASGRQMSATSGGRGPAMVVFRSRDYNARKLNMLHCTQPPQPPQAIDVAVRRGSLWNSSNREISKNVVRYHSLAEVAEVAEVPTRNVTVEFKDNLRDALQQSGDINMLEVAEVAEVTPLSKEREIAIAIISQRAPEAAGKANP